MTIYCRSDQILVLIRFWNVDLGSLSHFHSHYEIGHLTLLIGNLFIAAAARSFVFPSRTQFNLFIDNGAIP